VYEEKLREIIEAKAKGKKLPESEIVDREDTKVVDLMSRLKASIAASEGGAKHARKTAKKSATKSARKRRSA
jgi:non-homologous end joining protein Ku